MTQLIANKRTKRDCGFVIPVDVYGVKVAVVWGVDYRTLRRLARKLQCNQSPETRRTIRKALQRQSQGICTWLGDGFNMLVWLRERPRKASDYDTIYHELHHVVDRIAHHLDPNFQFMGKNGISEPKAYLYGYLATECNKLLWNWPKRQKKHA